MSTRRARRVTLSAVLIVKDEQDVLARCLESVRWADQIVVYDTGSTDATREIARQFTDVVVEGYWDDDFAGARNRALAHATGDWVLSIDADEEFVGDAAVLRRTMVRTDRVLLAAVIEDVADSPVDPTYDFVTVRAFHRTSAVWEHRLHEQLVAAPGLPVRAVVADGLRLRHYGYGRDLVEARDKGARNLALVRAELTDAERAGDPVAVAIAQAQLARTLAFGGQLGEVGDAVERAWASGLLPDQLVLDLCALAVRAAVATDRPADAELWVARWRSLAPTSPRCLLMDAALREFRGDLTDAWATFDRLPGHSTVDNGVPFRRVDEAATEVRLLVALDRRDEASAVAERAVREGSRSLSPVALADTLGADTLERLAPLLSDRQWRDWTLRCVQAGTRSALDVLTLMDRFRPDDLATILAATRLVPVMSLEEASEWSARLRRKGLDEECPLRAFAADRDRPARDRALAAALVVSAYRDARALPDLTDALDHVPTQAQRALAAELAVVAPGLVSLDE